MKLVLDTNKLYSFFWKGSLIKKLLLSEHDLYSPEFALEELDNHKKEILEKTGLTLNEFEEFKTKLKKVVVFVPFSEYSSKIPKAFNLLPEHPKDIDFLALALELNAGIISEDKKLNKQSKVAIFNNFKLAKLF